jgi:PhnB protein
MDPVVHFEMPYADKERLIKFYQQAFGWQMRQLGAEMGEYVTAATAETDENRMVKTPGAINGGFYPKGSVELPQPSIVISVDDVQAAMKKITDAGGKLLGEPMPIPGIGIYVSFTDSEGNRVSILQPSMNDRGPANKGKANTTKFVPYLNFAGNTEEAFNFYKSVFGGEFKAFFRFKDMPMQGVNIAKADENKIMHIALPIGKDDMLMASDVLESFGHKLVVGNNFTVQIFPESKEEADRLFNGLSTGGVVELKMTNQMWGDYYGALTDKFGTRWAVDYIYPKT